jgi:hypothetical protein
MAFKDDELPSHPNRHTYGATYTRIPEAKIYQSWSVSPVVDGGTKSGAFTIDLSAGETQQIILAGSSLPMSFANPVDGARYEIIYQQDETGSRLLPIHADIVMWGSDTAPVLATEAGASDIIRYTYRQYPTPRFYGVVAAPNLKLPTPQVQSVTTTAVGTASGTHNVSMPATVNAGDLLLVVIITTGPQAPATPSGWTWINHGGSSGGTIHTDVFVKAADGSEGGTTVNFSTSPTNTQAAAHCYRITRWYGNVSGVHATAATGSSATPDSPSDSAGWTDRTLWLSCAGVATQPSVNSGPSSYTNRTDTPSGGAGGCLLSTARRVLYASAENPSSFSISVSNLWYSVTISVRPPA